MEVLVVRLHGRHVSRVLLQILVIVERLRHFVVKSLTNLLSSDIVNELRSGFDADLGLNLPDESVSINLALIKALKGIVKLPCRLISKL